jgi:hypothetical protein
MKKFFVEMIKQQNVFGDKVCDLNLLDIKYAEENEFSYFFLQKIYLYSKQGFDHHIIYNLILRITELKITDIKH